MMGGWLHYLYKKYKKLDKLIDSLKDEFMLEREYHMEGFLGLIICKDDVKETVAIFQQGLIGIILRTTNLEDSNPNSIVKQ